MVASPVTAILLQLIISIIAFMSAITIHEFSHAFVAYLLGDDTAKRHGRLTLNPLAHIDPMGLLFLLIFKIGWATPVPMDPRNFRYPRLFSVLAGLAGPAANFVLALVLLYGIHYLPWHLTTTTIALAFIPLLKVAIWLNIMLGIFNLIPLPPLDGSHIIYALIPESWRPAYYRIARFSILILLFLFIMPQTQLALIHATEIVQNLLARLVF